MTARTYKSLALAWVPDSQEKKAFYLITAIVMACVLVLAVLVSAIDLPPKERQAAKAVPERVAKFINNKKEVATPLPTAVPTPPPPPPPPPTPKPKVVRQIEPEEKKPLTQEEKKARDTASQSGLLALGSELADLIDTTDVSQMVSARTRKPSGKATASAGVDTSVLSEEASSGSGGANTSDYVAELSATSLDARDVAAIKSSLTKDETLADNNAQAGKTQASKPRSGNVRTEEEVTIVFDQNKGSLFSIYNRERRKKPGLMGKLVLEITIAPNGSVSQVKVASTELNDPDLEKRIVARVKTFRFEAKDVETVTVTFPIEFLPS